MLLTPATQITSTPTLSTARKLSIGHSPRYDCINGHARDSADEKINAQPFALRHAKYTWAKKNIGHIAIREIEPQAMLAVLLLGRPKLLGGEMLILLARKLPIS